MLTYESLGKRNNCAISAYSEIGCGRQNVSTPGRPSKVRNPGFWFKFHVICLMDTQIFIMNSKFQATKQNVLITNYD
nr:hypothetical protein BgiMline_019054 [Biomphalaria glabrata]